MQFNLQTCAFTHMRIYAYILNVNRKGIYFIWVTLKSREVELKQQVKVSLEKYFVCFVMIVATI